MSKIIFMLTIKACQKTSHKIDKIFPNISKQAKRISENNRNYEIIPEELEPLRNELMGEKKNIWKEEKNSRKIYLEIKVKIISEMITKLEGK